MKPIRVPVSFNRGVNLLDDPAALKDDEVIKAKNLWMKKPGVTGKRPAMAFSELFFQEFISYGGTSRIIREFEFLADGLANSVVVFERNGGNDIMKLFPNVVKPPFYDQDPKEQNIGPSKFIPSTINYGKKTFVFNGQSPGWVFDPASLDADGQFNIVQNAWNFPAANTVMPSLVAVVRERFWYVNLGVGAEDYIVVSDRFEPSSITTTGVDPLLIGGRAFRVGKAGEGPITAVVELSATSAGSEASTMVAVWKRDKMFLITGEPLELDDVIPPGGSLIGDMDIIRVNTGAGCVSQRTVVTTPYGTLWAGADDVWCMVHGGQPQRIGTKIRPALKATPPGLMYLWHAAYDQGQYKLALFSEGLGPSELSPCDEQWWLDLQQSSETNQIPSASNCRWMGPQVYVQSSSDYRGTWNMKLDTRPNRPERLVSLTSYNINVEGAAGNLATGITMVDFQSPNVRDTCAPNISFRDWQSDIPYALNDIISIPVVGSDTVYRMQTFLVYQAGQSNIGRPTFDYGVSVADGGVIWTGEFNGFGQVATVLEPPSRQDDNEILMDIVTREMASDGMTDILWCGVEMGFSLSQSMFLKYVSIIDYELDTRFVSLESDDQLDVLSLDVSSINNLSLSRRFQTRLLTPDPRKKSIGKTGQIRIYDEANIVITEQNNRLTFFCNGIHTVTIGEIGDTFPNSVQFLDAIIQAITTELVIAPGVLQFTDGAIIKTYGSVALPADVEVVNSSIFGIDTDLGDCNRRILALLGFPMQTDQHKTLFIVNGTVSGDPTYYQKQVAAVELSGLNVLYRGFTRRPS